VLGRLGFAGRLMAIVLFAFVALWSIGTGWLFYSESRDDIASGMFPLPGQVAGIVELVESASPAQRPVVLKAVSTEHLRVTITDERPLESADTRRLPLAERFLRSYLSALQPRDVIVIGHRGALRRWREWRFGDYWRDVQRSIRFAVSLRGGDYLVFEAFGSVGRRLFGWPPGAGVGVLGALIGIAAVIAIAREARPLRALSDALGKFTGDAAGPLMEPAGAPEIRKLIVSVNEKSVHTLDQAGFGRPPYSRDVWAQATRELRRAGARVIAIDIGLSEEDINHPEGDRAFAEAVHRAAIVGVSAGQSSTRQRG